MVDGEGKQGEEHKGITFREDRLDKIVECIRLPGDPILGRMYCPKHGTFTLDDVLWKMIENKPQLCCPECDNPLIELKPCLNHGWIPFEKIRWENDEPHCPECHNKLC